MSIALGFPRALGMLYYLRTRGMVGYGTMPYGMVTGRGLPSHITLHHIISVFGNN